MARLLPAHHSDDLLAARRRRHHGPDRHIGIGTSEVEHVLATQKLLAKKAKSVRVRVDGALARGCSAKGIALAAIGRVARLHAVAAKLARGVKLGMACDDLRR